MRTTKRAGATFKKGDQVRFAWPRQAGSHRHRHSPADVGRVVATKPGYVTVRFPGRLGQCGGRLRVNAKLLEKV